MAKDKVRNRTRGHDQPKKRIAGAASSRWRINDWLKSGYQVLVAVVAAILVIDLLVTVRDAVTSHSVVVNTFKTPPALVSRGLTGDVTASAVLDSLQMLRAATRVASKELNVRSAWVSDVNIQVPKTGVSVGEIERILHNRFSHDSHIDGDLVLTATGGLALTVRGDGVPAQTFNAAKVDDINRLTTRAAGYIYGRLLPNQYLVCLNSMGHFTEAVRFAPTALAHASDDNERAEIANGWGNAYIGLNMLTQAAEKFRLAMSLKPRNWKAWGNLVTITPMVSGEEAAWKESLALLREAERAPKDDQPDVRYIGGAAANVWDLPLALRSTLADAAHNGGEGAESVIDGPTIADDYALMHDPARAARYLATSDPHDPSTKVEALLLKAYAALDRGDGAAAIPPLEAFWKAWQSDPNLQANAYDGPCLLGFAYGLAHLISKSEAVFKRAGRWSRCYAMHGDVLSHSGNLARASRVWAEGLSYGVDLPHIYLHRGVSELQRRDFTRAEFDISTASAKAPHWADPLKAWGDMLARKAQYSAAVAKYDEALDYAPAWSELHDARNKAAHFVKPQP